MSQMIKNIIMTCLLLAACMLALAGCGDSASNTRATISEGSGQHVAGWVPGGHKAAALENQSVCAGCHGSDFQGGISRVTCSRCHLGGAASIHPQDWIQDQTTVWSRHAAYTGSNGLAGCANATCHGPDLGGVAESGPSCTSCHLDGVDSIHPRGWGQNAAILHAAYVTDNGTAACANAACHGASFTGVANSGPSCTSCHVDSATSVHPSSFGTGTQVGLNHAPYVTANGNTPCQNINCHGTSLAGVPGSGPSCTSCHLGGVAAVHPADWGAAIITVHQTYVAANTSSACANAACHGASLTGGAGPSCSSCHLGGAISKHPLAFTNPIALNHSPFVAANGTGACANAVCHGPTLTGVNGPSCSSCHIGGPTSKHPADWGTGNLVALNHKAFVQANGASSCQNNYCHGPSLGGVTGSGPACATCHLRGSPLALPGCTSCHQQPPADTAAPNREGAHLEHNALTGVTSVCNTCHGGAGGGTVNHFNGVINTQLTATYNAKSGTAVRNPDGTCSNVSCHGGQTTPVWLTGTIVVDTACTTCHSAGVSAGTPENNSYYSGRHTLHTATPSPGISCFSCHDMVNLAPNHFRFLGTAEMEGPASGTIGGVLINSYAAGTCNAVCHPVDKSWVP